MENCGRRAFTACDVILTTTIVPSHDTNMSNPTTPESSQGQELTESFGDALSQFERSHQSKPASGSREGTVVSVSADSVFIDIGFKTEGILPLAEVRNDSVKPGDKIQITIKGRDPEGYYQLTRGKVARPTDWAGLEKAFADKATIVGTVTGVVKGGLSVDIGVRAFMPASRSGVRDAAEMGKLVEEEIRCRIIKLDAADEDVVVDRRAVLEEQEQAAKQQRYSELNEGDTITGMVRSLTDYGAFVDIGGVDALLHVGDLSWARVSKPADVLSVGQQVEVRVLKIDSEKHRISVGMKQTQADPWHSAAARYKVGERITGTVTRTTDFGAFIELEPGIEGLIHVSEMSWVKKVLKPSDLVKPGETVEAIILSANAEERRISLGLKQALGDPWIDAAKKFAVGTVVSGPVVSVTNFGAFVQVSEGVEGMIHVNDMSAEKRIQHPRDVLRQGEVVRAQVLEIDPERKRLKLGIKQLAPTDIDEYLAEHKQGDVVSGRVIDVSGNAAQVQLGEGVQATCRLSAAKAGQDKSASATAAKADVASLSSMLQARWKGGAKAESAKAEGLQAGQVRSFRITSLDLAGKKIEVELA